jgi:[ribosomal protein S5]-alanine N-acetyltransferase
MRLETPRLLIRSFEERDSQAWVALFTDPDVWRFLPPATAPVTLQLFQTALGQRQAMERDRGYTIWAVEEKGTGAFIGQCGVRPIEATQETELAYHFNKASWNKGYGTEAATAVLRFAFEQAGLDRVIALVMPENIGSCRVAEKAGMRFDRIADYFGLAGLKKYAADAQWWTPPRGQ